MWTGPERMNERGTDLRNRIFINLEQDTIARILHENGQLRDELKELKASLKSKDREMQNLQESLSKTCERNKALELERKAAKVKIDKQDGEIYNLWDTLDNLEQYTRKNSLEIHGVPKEAYSSTEEAVLAIANALDVDISSNDRNFASS